jgi:hypothetical protein
MGQGNPQPRSLLRTSKSNSYRSCQRSKHCSRTLLQRRTGCQTSFGRHRPNRRPRRRVQSPRPHRSRSRREGLLLRPTSNSVHSRSRFHSPFPLRCRFRCRLPFHSHCLFRFPFPFPFPFPFLPCSLWLERPPSRDRAHCPDLPRAPPIVWQHTQRTTSEQARQFRVYTCLKPS